MSLLLSLLSSRPYLTIPQAWYNQLFLLFVWILFLSLDIYLLNIWRDYFIKVKQRDVFLWMVLLALVPITSLFIGIRISSPGALPPPNVPIDPEGPAIMIFSCIPWILAGGILGVVQSATIAAFSGFFLAFWGIHSAFTPWIYGLFAIVYSVSIHQRYRTPIFRALRHPLFIGGLLALVYPLCFILSTSFLVGGNLAVRLDFAITHVYGASIAFAGSIFVACIFAEIYYMIIPAYWGNQAALKPSPAEKSMETRFVYTLFPLVVFLVITILIGTWKVAEKTSRKMVEERLLSLANIIGEGVPFFLQTGQSRIMQLAADDRIISNDPAIIEKSLQENLRAVPFFNQLFVLDLNGNSIAGFPLSIYNKSSVSEEEQYGILRALNGIPFQFYTGTPPKGKETAYISFLATLLNSAGEIQGVLIGQTELASNPLTKPLIKGLDNLKDINGYGVLIDENGKILYHPLSGLVMTQYVGMRLGKNGFFEEAGTDGTRQLVLYQGVVGNPWLIVLSVPFQYIQQNAIKIATPIGGLVLLLFLIAAIYFHFNMKNITLSLRELADHAGKISQGELDHPLHFKGEDEVAGLSKAFEHMRLGLKSRLEEQDRLLWVSQGVASSLELAQSIQPVLVSALDCGASCVRIVFTPDAFPELEGDTKIPVSYSIGPGNEKYSYLDDQVLNLLKRQERVILWRPDRPRFFNYPIGASQPQALFGIALRHENLYYGAFWLPFDLPHSFTEDEVRYLSTLAGHASLGVTNSRHFLNAEVGRRRLEAIINSTSDPVLVIDQQNRLLISNPAAWQAFGLDKALQSGQQIESIISQEDLVNLLKSTALDNRLKEIVLQDGKVYSATVSNVLAEGRPVGRVCLMRDVTYFKNMDRLKSDFVHTVSHDLRTPLSVIKGYASMLDMVGKLNEQQQSYNQKILYSVDKMTDLVKNLLDLGRIEAGVGLRLGLLSVREILEFVVSELQMLAAQKHLQLSLDISEDGDVSIEADQALLQRALYNLIENAIRYTEGGGAVTVRAKGAENRVIIEVEDTGIGIAPVDQSLIFDKFYRVDQPGDKLSTGTGLGLAIVKSIAEKHDGEVWVKSQLGKGSTFFLSIPLKQIHS